MDFKKAVELITKSKNVVITSHTRPDGDSCGCVKAMCLALERLGKEVHPLFISPVPQWYLYLFDEKVPVMGEDITLEQLQKGYFDGFDLAIVVDTNSFIQLPQFEEWLKSTKAEILVIDHHLTSDGLGDIELVDTSAAATGQIVLELFHYAGWKVDKEIAEALFVALSTDTGWFKFSNTDKRCFLTAAELITTGLNPADIYRKLYQNFSPARMKLLSRMLQTIELHFDGRLAIQHILREDFDATGAKSSETEGLVDECQKIGTVEAAVMLVELKEGGFRCSLRSKGKIDVRIVAQKFGGGGHTMAAGVTISDSLENAKNLIFDAIKEQFDRLDSSI